MYVFLGDFPRRWFFQGSLGVEQNDELGILLRLSAGGGPGRFLMRRNKSYVKALVGGNLNRETARDTRETTINAEASARLDYATLRFNDA